MFGYIKRSEVLELLENEVRFNRIQMNVNSALLDYEDLTDSERECIERKGEKLEHRYNESVRILHRVKERI